MNSERLKMIDLFSGAGGLSEGLSEAGFHSLFASEIVPVYAQTYKKNHTHTNVFTADIRTLDANEVRTTLGIERGELDLIAGGPPCQGFSINAPVRTTLDERNHLFKEYLRFVDAFAPRAVLIENVPGLVSFEHGATLHAILDALAELGYGADVRILGAPYYGVPQMRWRTIILGVRGRALPAGAYPEPIYHAPIRANFTSTFDGPSIIKEPSPEANANFVTVYEAIGDLPPLVSGEQGEVIKEYRCDAFCDYQRRSRLGSVGVMNHEAPRLSPINLKRLEYIQPGGNWTDIPDELLLVPMDARLIVQVLVNLLDNAIKHTAAEREIRIAVQREGTDAVFRVSDRGEGIAPADLPHIFKMFYTSQHNRADAKRGIGLGLAICDAIVKAHGGTIRAENRTDGGALFRFTLPMEVAENA